MITSIDCIIIGSLGGILSASEALAGRTSGVGGTGATGALGRGGQETSPHITP
jgi:hypothetical protein